MSGGSWDYVYHKFDDAAHRLQQSNIPLRRALGHHMELVAKAMHDIEWVDSADYSKGEDHAAIHAVLGANSLNLELTEILKETQRVSESLNEAVARRDMRDKGLRQLVIKRLTDMTDDYQAYSTYYFLLDFIEELRSFHEKENI